MRPSLSICIPTFNRCGHLEVLLQSIVSQAIFLETDKVEIVIGDNCSTDGTPALARRYQEQFGEKIRYFRNETNVDDLNFERVLRAGTGEFLKLINDRVVFRAGVPAFLVALIEGSRAEKPILFSLNKQMQSDARVLLCGNLNDFVAAVSYSCTWIGAFGIWREDLASISDFSRRTDLYLTQVDALFRQFTPGRRCMVLNETHYLEQNLSFRKGGYSVAKVFGANYLRLLGERVAAGEVSDAVFQLEKKRVLLEHILPYYFSNAHDFVRGDLSVHLKDYLEEDYFYQALEQLQYGKPVPDYASLSGFARLQRRWRLLNAHNGTLLASYSGTGALQNIFVGNESYGELHVWSFGSSAECLRIGHYCSIAAEVHFILGGNHPHDTLSTFPFRVKHFGHASEATTRGPIVLGDDVWLGHRATVLSGVTIGQGAVVAAGSVVVRDVEPYAIVAGNPARVLKYRFDPEIRQRLAGVQYGRLTPQRVQALKEMLLQKVDATNIDALIAAVNA